MGSNGFSNVLDQCLGIRPGEQVVLLTDGGTDAEVVTRLLEAVAARDGIPLVAQMPAPHLPGAEPPGAVAAMMAEAAAIIELTSLFIGSSRARRDATSRGGTDLRGSVADRPGRVLHGIATQPGDYMAPPDIESGTAPVEGTVSGTVVVDGDLLFMGQGPLVEPVVLHIVDGQVRGIEGPERRRLTTMLERCQDDRMANLAEVSVAFNPAGSICSVPMETESARGTAHVALGNSIAYGGVVNAVAHLDCVMRDATLELDGRAVMIEGAVQ